MNINDELFREVFKTLHRELNPKEKKPSKDQLSTLATLSVIPPVASKKIIVQKQLLEMKYKEEKQLLQLYQKRFDLFTSQTDEVLSASRLACKIRLHQQKRTANKRLQELIFEVLGEYKKALLRAQRRETYLSNYGRVQVTLTTWNHRWQRFLFFLEMELNKKTGSLRSASPMRQKPQTRPANVSNTSPSYATHLSPSVHTQELHHLSKILSQRMGLISEESFQIMTAVRFRRVSAVRAAPATALTVRLDNTLEELQTTLDILAAWLAGSSHLSAPSDASNATIGSAMSVPAHTLLSNDRIAWLHPSSSAPHLCDALITNHLTNGSDDSGNNSLLRFFQSVYMQHSSSLFNSRVYICLEERQLLQELQRLSVNNTANVTDMETTNLLLSSLQDCYVSNRPPRTQASDALQKLRLLLSSSCLQVSQHLKRHRSLGDATHEKIALWPDVVAATLTVASANNTCVTLHFAPATVLNLLEASVDHKTHHTETLQLFCVSVMPLPVSNSVLATCDTPKNANNSVSSDPFRLCLVPLRHSIVSRLCRGYFPLSGSSVSETASSWGALQLLPDHCRSRHITTHPSRDTKDTKPSVEKLHHHYALIADENHFVDGVATPAEDTNSSNKRTPVSCVYLVQLCREATLNKDDTDSLKLFPDVSLQNNQQSSKHTRQSNLTASAIVTANDGFIEQFAKDEEMFRVCVLEEQRRHCKQPLVVRPKSTHNSGVASVADILPTNPLLAEQLSNNNNTNFNLANSNVNNNKRDWDTAVMSELCFWRACLCHSCQNVLLNNSGTTNSANGGVLLCRYHQELRLSLDQHLSSSSTSSTSSTSNTSESAKFLPKKPPVIPLCPANSNSSVQDTEQWQNKRDLQLLRAASTLLQELWDGRLKNTVKIFAKKIATDMRQRAVAEAALLQMKRLLLAYQAQSPQTPKQGVNPNIPVKSSNNNNKTAKAKSNSKFSGNVDNFNNNFNNNQSADLQQQDKDRGVATLDVSQLVHSADLHTLQRLSQFQLPTTPTWAMLRNNPNISLKTQQDTSETQESARPVSTGVVTAQQTQALSFLQRIKELETAVTQEIRLFAEELRVFPAAEITHMRRDIRSFKDLQEHLLSEATSVERVAAGDDTADPQYLLLSVLSEEVKLCDRKWSLLKQRRLAEEEQRLLLMRRMQRQRQMEEAQMKDPANFNFNTNTNNNNNNNNRNHR